MKKDNKKGFTFIETLIYIALATMVLGIIFSYGWNILSLREKSTTVNETYSDAELLNERLKREIRSTSSVDKDNSIFGSVPGKLVLKTDNGDVTIEVVNDKVSIKRGNGDAVFLHRDSVRIKSFLLTKEESADGEILYVGFSFDVQAYFPEAGNRFEYQYSVPIESGAEIRNQ